MPKAKKSATQIVHLARGVEILLVLGPDDERIKGLKEKGFVVQGFYRLSRTGGNLANVLPKTGVFADAASPLCKSPWMIQIEERRDKVPT